MGLRINQNIAAQNAYRNLSVTDGQMAKSLEKLSSGFRINRAADDAAGLSISEGLRAQVGGTKVAIRNAQDGISVVQTAEGALSEVHSILQRMRDLSVQSANTGGQDSTATAAAQSEIDELNNELNRIGATTSFGSTKLLTGSFGAQEKLSGTNAAWANKTITTANNTFELSTEVGGSTQTVTVSLTAGTYTSGEDLATEFNRGIRAALVGAGGTGSEVSANYVVDSAGAGGKFEVVGVNSFTIDDANGVDAAEAGGDDENAAYTHLGVSNAVDGGVATSASSGSGGVFQVGANVSVNDRISVSLGAVNTTTLGTASLNVNSAAGAQAAVTAIDDAIKTVSNTRATLGAFQNRFEHTIANLSVAAENLSASESRIRDADMAQEMVSFTRSQILTQAGTAMLAQANQAPQQVLSLLR